MAPFTDRDFTDADLAGADLRGARVDVAQALAFAAAHGLDVRLSRATVPP